MKRILPIAIALAALVAFSAETLEVQLQRAVQKEAATGDLKAAIEAYKKIAASAGSNHTVAAQALLHEAEAHQKLGDAQARKIYEQIVKQYPDQKDAVSLAQSRLNSGGNSDVVDQRVWTLPLGSLFLNRVSPDGRYVAYTRGTDLMVRELASGIERSIVHFAKGQPGLTLAWSRDGRRLAFEFVDETVEIRTVNLDGSGMHTVLPGPHPWARVLDFFPDGKRLLCSMAQGNDTLVFWISLADDRVHELVVREGSGGSGWPRLSPDGRYVALRHLPGLSLLPVDEKDETIISRNQFDLNPAGWSSDGSRLLFVRVQDNRFDLWAQPVANGKPNGAAVPVFLDFGNNTIGNVVTNDGSLYYERGRRSSSLELHVLRNVIPAAK